MVVMTKEQAVISCILKSFPGIKIMRRYSALNNKYEIDTYLPDQELAIKVDEKAHTVVEEKRDREIREELGCDLELIRINKDSKDFDMNAIIGTISNYIIESTKKLVEDSAKNNVEIQIM